MSKFTREGLACL